MKTSLPKLLIFGVILLLSNLANSQVPRRWVAAGHDGTLADIQVERTGKFFVTSGKTDGRIIVWDGQTQKYRWHNDVIIPGKNSPAENRPIAIAPNGAEIAVADTIIRFYDPMTGAMTTMLIPLPKVMLALQYSSTGDTLTWVGLDTTYYTGLIDLVRHTSQTVKHLGISSTDNSSGPAAISDDGLEAILDGGMMVSTITDHIIWSTNNADRRYSFYGKDSVIGQSWSEIKVYDRMTHTLQRSILAPTLAPYFQEVRGGPMMLAYSNGTVSKLNVATGKVGWFAVGVVSRRLTPDVLPRMSNRIAGEIYLGSMDPQVWFPEDRLMDLGADLIKVRTDESMYYKYISTVNQPPVVSAIAPNDSLVVVGALGLTAFDRYGNASIRPLGHVVAASISSDSKSCLVAAHFNGDNDYGHNYIYTIGGDDVESWPEEYDGRGTYIPNWGTDRSAGPSFTQSPDGSKYAMGESISDTLPKSVFLWNSYAHHIWSPSSAFVYVLMADSLTVFESSTKKKMSGQKLGQSRVKSFALDVKGERIATAAGDGTLKVWTLPDLSLRHTFMPGHGSLNAVKFSPDGNSLITADSDGTIAILDAETGAEKLVIRDSLGSFNGVEVTHDGKDIIGLVEIGVVDYDHIPVILSGVAELAARSQRLSCYPNPTRGKMRIVFDLPIASPYNVELIDALGRVVYRSFGSGKLGGNELMLDLTAEEIPAGHYLCRMKSGEYQALQNVIVE